MFENLIKFGFRFLPLIFKSVTLHCIKSCLILLLNVCKNAGLVANSVDPDQTPRSAASDLGLHCLLRPDFPNR